MTQYDRNSRPGFFYRTSTIRGMLWGLYALCLTLLAADLIFHRHVTHPWEGLFGFYAFYGFSACVLLVLVAKQMRRLLMRAEDYYDRDRDA